MGVVMALLFGLTVYVTALIIDYDKTKGELKALYKKETGKDSEW